MKYLILSDIHGNRAALARTLQKEQDADAVCFLGDGLFEMEEMTGVFSAAPFYLVRGNCDASLRSPAECLVSLGGKLAFLTHGNGYEVKLTLQALKKAARQRGADIALFGHTHQPFYEYDDGLYLFNPGSLAFSYGGQGSYGLLFCEEGLPPRFEHREAPEKC